MKKHASKIVNIFFITFILLFPLGANAAARDYCGSLIEAFQKATDKEEYTPLHKKYKNLGKRSTELCKKMLAVDAKATEKILGLHRHIVENFYRVEYRRWFSVVKNLNYAISKNNIYDTVGLMKYYLSKYDATKDKHFAYVASQLGGAGNLGGLNDIFEHSPLSTDEIIQYGELLAVISSLHIAKTDLNYIWVKIRAKRLTKYSNPEISSLARKIVNIAESKYKEPNYLLLILGGIVALGAMMPDNPPSSADHSWKQPPMDLGEQLEWLK